MQFVPRIYLIADAAWRLGPRPVALALWGKGPGRWWAAHRLGAPQRDTLGETDVRPIWEEARWTTLPDDPQAAVLAWMAANPPFGGVHWQCGQEASLRVLQLARRLVPPLPDWARPVLQAHGRRIAANPAYALAQDNNHPISEAAGRLACALLLGGNAAAASRRLDRVVQRLVSADGAFAQPSPAYHRLMVDVLVAVEALRVGWGGPPSGYAARAAAAVRVLRRMAVMPRIGHQDGSAFDGQLAPDLDRAEASFGRLADDAGPWAAGWLRGWRAAGAQGFLRVGAPFRPAQADFLHFDLWDAGVNLLRDAGTGAYNPAPADRWWLEYFWSTAAHNTVEFDGEDQMPRAGRFLHARWPQWGRDADGDWVRDWRGRRHARAVEARGREWRVVDRLAGPFREAVLRWRLAPGQWRLTDDGVQGPLARITVAGGAVTLEEGWESLAYGQVSRCPVLVARGVGFETVVRLP